MTKTTKTKKTKVPTNLKRIPKEEPSDKKVIILTILQLLLNGEDYMYDESRTKNNKKYLDKNRGILKRITLDELEDKLGFKIPDRNLGRYLEDISSILDDPESDKIRRVTDVIDTDYGRERVKQIEMSIRLSICPQDIDDIESETNKKLLREFCILDYLHDNHNNIDGYEKTKAYKHFYQKDNRSTYLRDLKDVKYVLDKVFNISI